MWNIAFFFLNFVIVFFGDPAYIFVEPIKAWHNLAWLFARLYHSDYSNAHNVAPRFGQMKAVMMIGSVFKHWMNLTSI